MALWKTIKFRQLGPPKTNNIRHHQETLSLLPHSLGQNILADPSRGVSVSFSIILLLFPRFSGGGGGGGVFNDGN